LTQQIDIINQTYTNNTSSYAPTDNSLGLWQYNTDRFEAPAKKIYFEAVVYDGTSWGRLRSSNFSLTDNTEYTVRAKLDSSCYVSLFDSAGTQVTDSEVSTTTASACTLKAARVLIKQYINPTVGADSGIDATTNYINLSVATTTYVTATTSLEHPTYYYYDADLFDPIPNAYLEATFKASSSEPISGEDDDTGAQTASNIGGGDTYTSGWTASNLATDDTSYANYSSVGSATGDIYTFGISLDVGTTIRGIEVSVIGREEHNGCNGYTTLALSWDGGSSWTSTKSCPSDGEWNSGSDESCTVGGASDDWGHTPWSASEASDDNLWLRAVTYNSRSGKAVSLDRIILTVYYTTPSTPGASSISYAQVCAVGGTCVEEAWTSSNSSSWTLARSDSFALSDNTEYELRVRSSSASIPAYLANAHLVLYQQGTVDKTEAVRQLINATSTNSGATWTTQKFPVLYDANEYGSSTRVIYYESTLKNNSSTYGSRLAPGSLGTLNSGSAGYDRERSGVLSLTDDTEYDSEIQYSDITSSWLLIQLSGLNQKPDYQFEGEFKLEGDIKFD
jgi:hypothetical protein